jgi:hypothetical protein
MEQIVESCPELLFCSLKNLESKREFFLSVCRVPEEQLGLVGSSTFVQGSRACFRV